MNEGLMWKKLKAITENLKIDILTQKCFEQSNDFHNLFMFPAKGGKMV